MLQDGMPFNQNFHREGHTMKVERIDDGCHGNKSVNSNLQENYVIF